MRASCLMYTYNPYKSDIFYDSQIARVKYPQSYGDVSLLKHKDFEALI